MSEIFKIDNLDYDGFLKEKESGEVQAKAFPLFPNTNFREYWKRNNEGLNESIIKTNYKDFKNVIACKFTYEMFNGGIEIKNIVESPYTPNIAINILIKYFISEFYNIFIPLYKKDFKFWTKLPIVLNDEVRVELLKIENDKLINENSNIFTLLKEDDEVLNDYRLTLRYKLQYEDI